MQYSWGATWQDRMLFVCSLRGLLFRGAGAREAGRWNKALMELDSPGGLFACPLLSFPWSPGEARPPESFDAL